MTRLSHYVTNALSIAAAVLAFQLAEWLDAGEETGGMGTGPMILACLLSAPVLVASVVGGLRSHRLGLALLIAGSVLAAPLATWRLAPGLWGMISPWPTKDELPLFRFDWLSLALLTCLFASLALQSRLARK
jgi:hypothetical protein